MAKKTTVVALIIILALSLVFGLVACKKPEPIDPGDNTESNEPNDSSDVDITDFFTAEELATFNYDVTKYTSSTQVGFSSKTLGTVERYRPVEEIRDERDVFPLGIALPANSPKYPKYGSTMNAVIGGDSTKIAARRALESEASYLTATGTATAGGGQYTWMDENGYLYRGTTKAPVEALYQDKTSVKTGHRQLYKHTAAAGMYGGDVSDSEQGLIKQIKYRPRSSNYGYYITGLYAPAGEVIKVEISAANMNATGGLTFHIGQCLYNGKNNNIWPEKNAMNRFPMIMNTLQFTKNTTKYNPETDTYVGYIGSFVGGPIYIRNESVTFDVTISGGVAYRHFILGYTSQKEFEETSKSTAPYFDLDVWDCGVLHSGPLRQARNYSYEDIYKAAVLWDKVASVTTTNGSKQGIVFLYDPFVAAGAAVAFPGQGSVNCPESWMRDALNYNGIVTSGSWGNFHEYHHNFQNYGLGSGADGEVTNNGLNLVSYSLFTKISANRGVNSYGAQGLSGWNRYTSSTWALNQVNTGSIGSTNGLAIYATLLHNFGQEQYIKARGASGKNNYLNRWASNTHQDMTYYASKIESYGGGTYTPSQAIQNANYPLFVPVASVYQTGRSYMYDDVKRDIKTMQPYVIPFGYNFTVDLRPYNVQNNQYVNGSVIIGAGFKYTIKSVSQPENGRLVETETPDVYTYIPDTSVISLLSGQIRVTIEITTTDGAKEWNGHRLDDVDLILEFQQTHESKKTTLERTVYNFDSDKMYTDAVEAFESGFAGYSSVSTRDHSNPTQNANTDIWFATSNSNPDYVLTDNHVDVVDGKLYFSDDGKYRIYLRGRSNCALYFSFTGFDNTYQLGARITKDTPFVDKSKTYQFRSDKSTYFDIQFSQGKVTVTVYANVDDENGKTYNYTIDIKEGKQSIENWLYIKEVLVVQKSSSSFVGVGMRPWTETAFTMTEKYYKSDDDEITTDNENFEDELAYTKTIYVNQANAEVAYSRKDKKKEDDEDEPITYYYKKNGNTWEPSTLEEVTKLTQPSWVEPAAVTSSSQPTYSNAYRRSYELPDNKGFTSEYFYKKTYNYNFSYSDRVNYKAKSIVKISNNGESAYPAANLIDGNTGSSFHTANTGTTPISASNPFELEVDMGEVIKANHVTFYYYNKGSNSKNNVGMVKTFTLQGSLSGEDNSWFDIVSKTDYVNDKSPSNVTFDFETTEFRYYRLYVTATDNGRHFAMNEIAFYNYNPEKDLSLKGNGANNLSLDDKNVFRFSENNWLGMSVESVFGHVYVGKASSTLKFEFEGTRIGFITSQAAMFDNNFEVFVDGKKVNSVDLWPVNGAYGITYLSQRLPAAKDENGEICNRHVVMVRCLGLVGLDSVVYYTEAN